MVDFFFESFHPALCAVHSMWKLEISQSDLFMVLVKFIDPTTCPHILSACWVVTAVCTCVCSLICTPSSAFHCCKVGSLRTVHECTLIL